jgi:hypothetical protein
MLNKAIRMYNSLLNILLPAKGDNFKGDNLQRDNKHGYNLKGYKEAGACESACHIVFFYGLIKT